MVLLLGMENLPFAENQVDCVAAFTLTLKPAKEHKQGRNQKLEAVDPVPNEIYVIIADERFVPSTSSDDPVKAA